MPATLLDALASAAALGPFFTVVPFEARDSGQDWWPLDALPASVLTKQLAATGGFLGTQEQRTLGSILHLGAAAALCSPVLAIAAIRGYVPALSAANVAVSYPPVGPLRVSLSVPVPVPESPMTPALLPELADQLISVALDGLLAPFTAALTAIEPIPEQTLAGNAFSALAAAARLIAPPEAGRRARALVDLMARRSPLLRDAGELHWQQPGAGHEYFRRRNCCLFYRVPGAGTCGDCVLD